MRKGDVGGGIEGDVGGGIEGDVGGGIEGGRKKKEGRREGGREGGRTRPSDQGLLDVGVALIGLSQIDALQSFGGAA